MFTFRSKKDINSVSIELCGILTTKLVISTAILIFYVKRTDSLNNPYLGFSHKRLSSQSGGQEGRETQACYAYRLR